MGVLVLGIVVVCWNLSVFLRSLVAIQDFSVCRAVRSDGAIRAFAEGLLTCQGRLSEGRVCCSAWSGMPHLRACVGMIAYVAIWWRASLAFVGAPPTPHAQGQVPLEQSWRYGDRRAPVEGSFRADAFQEGEVQRGHQRQGEAVGRAGRRVLRVARSGAARLGHRYDRAGLAGSP